MKKLLFFLALTSLFAACNNKKGLPDISDIKVDVPLERFDKDVFSIDTTNIVAGLNQLDQKYPELTSIFIQNILGLDSSTAYGGLTRFIQMSKPIRDTIDDVFKNTNDIEKEFEEAFRYVKYYFPDFNPPKLVTIVGPVDALAQSSSGPTPNFLRSDFLGISLQFYLGPNFSVYQHPVFVEQVAPLYRSRRFSKEYIIADGMALVVDNMFPGKSAGKPLIEQVIERGKQWYMLDLFLPEKADSIKTGYTQQQLDWVNANEGQIWTEIVRAEDLYSVNPTTIQNYIGEAPFTSTLSQEASPGNIGQWIGWQIVKKFVSKNTGMKPEEVMNTPAKKILDEAKYKPK